MSAKSIIAMASPDWVTITTTDGQFTEPIQRWVLSLINENADARGPKRWRAMGYAGWQCTNIKTGIRGAGEGISMFSGEGCTDLLKNAPINNFKVTRFDIQVTVSLDTPAAWIAKQEYDRLEKINDQRGRKRYIKIIRSSTGDTLYVGKRTSSVMLRMYDKTSSYNEGQLGMYWRYEVEFKKASAQRAYDAWARAKRPEEWVVSQVGAEFLKRSVDPGFPVGIMVNAIETTAEVSTDDGRIRWLSKCVAPVVAQLIYNGRQEEVLKVLRLNNLLTIKESFDGSKRDLPS